MAPKDDNTMQWVHLLLLDETGRLVSLVPSGLDRETQTEILRAIVELTKETTARISEVSMSTAEV